MIIEKTIIVLSQNNGVIKITKKDELTTLELSTTLVVSECKILIRHNGNDEIYPVELTAGRGSVVIDEINPRKADFCLLVNDSVLAVGNCGKIKPSPSEFLIKPSQIVDSEINEDESAKTFPPKNGENDTYAQVSIDKNEYNDEQIAQENYYESENLVVGESEKSIRNQIKLGEETAIKIEEKSDKIVGRKLTYYEKVSDEIEQFFRDGERVESLEKALPFTRWIKVNNGEMKGCVVGLIGETPTYICYGLPGRYEPICPQELEKFCQWLPLDVKNPQGEGYWLIYQSALTGKTVRFD